MKVLLFDNYDSFTYNLAQMIEQITGEPPSIVKNDSNSFEEIDRFDKIIISPGPGIPSEAGNLLEMISYFAEKKPILGVCLGMQAIGEVYGGKLINLSQIYHGVGCTATKTADHKIFSDLPDSLQVGRYHSWAVDSSNFPQELTITSTDDEGNIMSLKHRNLEVHGVQYHPESILTPRGKDIVRNFLTLT